MVHYIHVFCINLNAQENLSGSFELLIPQLTKNLNSNLLQLQQHCQQQQGVEEEEKSHRLAHEFTHFYESWKTHELFWVLL